MNKLKRYWLVMLLCVLVSATAVPWTLALIFERSATYVNTFHPDASLLSETEVCITIYKTIRSSETDTISPEGFQFVLTESRTGEKLIAASNAEGIATLIVDTADYAADASRKYMLTEINDGRAGVTYSRAQYAIEIFAPEKEGLQAQIALDGVLTENCVARFENVYVPATAEEIPDTGDHSKPALYIALLMLSVGGLALLRRGRRKN